MYTVAGRMSLDRATNSVRGIGGTGSRVVAGSVKADARVGRQGEMQKLANRLIGQMKGDPAYSKYTRFISLLQHTHHGIGLAALLFGYDLYETTSGSNFVVMLNRGALRVSKQDY
jgi:hypothetical protein